MPISEDKTEKRNSKSFKNKIQTILGIVNIMSAYSVYNFIFRKLRADTVKHTILSHSGKKNINLNYNYPHFVLFVQNYRA